MKKTKRASFSRREFPRSARSLAAEENRPEAGPAKLKPRKGLFVLISIVLGLWCIALLAMYFTTVYPHRKSAPATSRPSAVAAAWAAVLP